MKALPCKVLALSLLLVVSTTSQVVTAVTLPTRNVGGVYVYSPGFSSSAIAFIWTAAQMMSRGVPWVTTLTIGYQIGKVVVDSMPISTRGLVDANRAPVLNNTSYSDCWAVSNAAGGVPAPTVVSAPGQGAQYCQPTYAMAKAWWKSATEYAAGPGKTCTISNETSSDPTFQYFFNYSCTNGWNGSSNLSRSGYFCGGTFVQNGSNPVTICGPASTPAKGGTTAWAPRSMIDPNTGAETMGWEAPSDPTAQTTATPSDTYLLPREAGTPVSAPQPTVVFTPREDGGYQVSTYSPNFTNNVFNNTYTYQSFTVNNAGQVTNVTYIVATPNGPPVTAPPVSDAASPPNPNTDCGSLSCESTQLQVRDELRAAGAPTLSNQQARIDQGVSDGDVLRDSTRDLIITQQQSDVGLWPGWSLTVAGSCSATSGSVHGWPVAINYCPAVETIRALLGWLFAVFASYFVWQQLFRREG